CRSGLAGLWRRLTSGGHAQLDVGQAGELAGFTGVQDKPAQRAQPAGRSGLAGTWIYRVMAAPGAAADALEVAHAGLHLRAAVQDLGVPTTQLVGVLAAAEIDPGQRQHEGAK